MLPNLSRMLSFDNSANHDNDALSTLDEVLSFDSESVESWLNPAFSELLDVEDNSSSLSDSSEIVSEEYNILNNHLII